MGRKEVGGRDRGTENRGREGKRRVDGNRRWVGNKGTMRDRERADVRQR